MVPTGLVRKLDTKPASRSSMMVIGFESAATWQRRVEADDAAQVDSGGRSGDHIGRGSSRPNG